MPRKRGDGSIVQRRDGLWQVSLQLNGVRRTAYAKTEREVRAKLRTLQQQAHTDGALSTPGRHTVSDLIDAWLTSAPNLKPSTVAQYRLFGDTYICPVLGRVGLERVTPDQLQKLYGSLAPSVADKVHRILHRAFAVAVLWRWLLSNPADRVLKPDYTADRPTVWTHAELHTFVDGTADHWLQPLFVLLLTTGMRLGEALALTWADVGLGVAVSVTGTLHRIDGQWMVGEPKTPSANRTIVLPPVAIDALKRQKAQQDAWQRTQDWEQHGAGVHGRNGPTAVAQHRAARPETSLPALGGTCHHPARVAPSARQSAT